MLGTGTTTALAFALSTGANSKYTCCEEPSPSLQEMSTFDMLKRIEISQHLNALPKIFAKKKDPEDRNESTKNLQPIDADRLSKFARSQHLKRNEEISSAEQPLKIDYSHLNAEQAKELIDVVSKGEEQLHPGCLLSILESGRHLLTKDETLVDLSDCGTENVVIVGDLHGSLSSLQFVLNKVGEIGKDTTLLFDGDFVDRGSHSLEVLLILILLKIAYPSHVFLLRGNHEDVVVASAYGCQDELVEKYGTKQGKVIWDSFSGVFCALPLAAVTETAVILHGGLPSKDFSLDEIRAISSEQRCQIRTVVEDPESDMTGRMVQSLLWSDPSTTDGIHPNDTRTVGVFFGPDIASDFLRRHHRKHLIRAHEVAENGASIMDCGSDCSVITVFSQPGYPNGTGNNLGAILRLVGGKKKASNSPPYELVRFSRDSKQTKQ